MIDLTNKINKLFPTSISHVSKELGDPQGDHWVKNPPTMQEIRFQDGEDCLEEGTATHSSVLLILFMGIGGIGGGGRRGRQRMRWLDGITDS